LSAQFVVVGSPAWWPAFAGDEGTRRVDSLVAAAALLDQGDRVDALVLDGDGHVESAADVAAAAARAALVVVSVDAEADHALGWIRQGAEDVIDPLEVATPGGRRRLRFAIARHRRGERRALAYATDPATGLPHRRQLIEHLSQLLALRERDPSPMAVLALRVELPGGADRDLIWRKAAVRLRAAVRASDVVAAADDALCVVLGTLLDESDGPRVAAKLAAALVQPYPVGDAEARLAVAMGVASYPGDGRDAERLLRRALALAAVAPALSAGQGSVGDRPGAPSPGAANDA
jgi:GGDEF domain-containing protein